MRISKVAFLLTIQGLYFGNDVTVSAFRLFKRHEGHTSIPLLSHGIHQIRGGNDDSQDTANPNPVTGAEAEDLHPLQDNDKLETLEKTDENSTSTDGSQTSTSQSILETYVEEVSAWDNANAKIDVSIEQKANDTDMDNNDVEDMETHTDEQEDIHQQEVQEDDLVSQTQEWEMENVAKMREAADRLVNGHLKHTNINGNSNIDVDVDFEVDVNIELENAQSYESEEEDEDGDFISRGGATKIRRPLDMEEEADSANVEEQDENDERNGMEEQDDDDDSPLEDDPQDQERDFDEALVEAFLPLLHLPPPLSALEHLRTKSLNIDVSARRRLDRRTLYQSLLLELSSQKVTSSGTGKTKRNYLSEAVQRDLKGALSLACQPRWRRHLVNKPKGDEENGGGMPWWWRGGVRLYSTDEEEAEEQSMTQKSYPQQQPSMGFFGEEEEMEEEDNLAEERERHPPCTMAMQETVAMAVAHSLDCGLVVLDDVGLAGVRQKMVEEGIGNLDSRSTELRNSNLVGHLIRLANEGKLPHVAEKQLEISSQDNVSVRPSHDKAKLLGRVSDRMERDLALGLDDPFDELAIESMKLMKEDEDYWYEEAAEKDAEDSVDDTEGKKPLSLVLFLRTDVSTSLLKSKSAVDRLARECVSEDSIHLLMLGKGIDAATVHLPSSSTSSSVASSAIRMRPNQRSIPSSPPSLMGPGAISGNPFFQQNPQPKNPFAGMSNIPPQGANIQYGNGAGSPGGPFGFTQQNINASGVHDPEGSRRFNIFLARTVDKDGSPGITGAIAPPQAGNLFPQMLAMQAKENWMQSQKDGDSEEDQQKHEAMVQRWSELMESHAKANNGQPLLAPQFFNASIGSPFGPGGNQMDPQQNIQNFNAMAHTPPEVIQQAIEHAVTEVMEQLTELSDQSDKRLEGALPPQLAKAFAEILSNENLRRGIAENLARAAPALVDPRCQGVMLSVYVPPGPDHPNRGLMPGQQKQHQGKKASSRSSKRQEGSSNSSMGGWLNKILSSSTTTNDSSSAAVDIDSIEDITDDEEDEEEEDNLDQGADSSRSTESSPKSAKKKKSDRRARIAAVAAATAMIKDQTEKSRKSSSANGGATKNQPLTPEQKVAKHLNRLQALCQGVPLRTPTDPVRSLSWDAWASRERGAIVFRKNRRALNGEMSERQLRLKTNVGSKGMGSVLRQMMSIKDISYEMDDVIKCAVESEAARSQRLKESPWDANQKEMSTVPVDNTLEQLILLNEESIMDSEKRGIHYIHPSSIETALSVICRVSPSPSGSSSLSTSHHHTVHRTKEEIAELAQDKHEKALVSQVVSPQDIGVSYDMIGGLSNVKELLRQSITYPLKFPHLYSEGIAKEAVKGVLLFGPPGTGKTMLAKAVATEGGATFLSVDASCVENKWLGESEKNAKAVFTLARRLAPCVIFIDEVDSILSSREGSSDDSAHGTLTSVKTTMMSEWDGLNSGTNGKGEAGSDRVVVIGSTNRPFDLDEAVLRRFPRRILVDLPDLETRREILEVTLAENRLDPSVNVTAIAERLDGYTGSDIKEVCREAVVQISHEQARMLDQGYGIEDTENGSSLSQGAHDAGMQRLRPVTMKDFDNAMSKLKRSVSEKGKELMKVWEWNDEYGEIKKRKQRMPQLMNMFV